MKIICKLIGHKFSVPYAVNKTFGIYKKKCKICGATYLCTGNGQIRKG